MDDSPPTDKAVLRKALSLGEKLKRKAQFEREVSRELESKNQRLTEECRQLRASLEALRRKHEELLAAANDVVILESVSLKTEAWNRLRVVVVAETGSHTSSPVPSVGKTDRFETQLAAVAEEAESVTVTAAAAGDTGDDRKREPSLLTPPPRDTTLAAGVAGAFSPRSCSSGGRAAPASSTLSGGGTGGPRMSRERDRQASSSHCVLLPAARGFSLHRKTSEFPRQRALEGGLHAVATGRLFEVTDPPHEPGEADGRSVTVHPLRSQSSGSSSGIGGGGGNSQDSTDMGAGLASGEVVLPAPPLSDSRRGSVGSALTQGAAGGSGGGSGPLLFEHFLAVGAPEAAAHSLFAAMTRRLRASTRVRARQQFNIFSSASREKDRDRDGGHLGSAAGSASRETPVQKRRAAYQGGGLLSPSRHALDRTDDSLTVDPAILFRYPAEADPPPNEVSDFCLPVRGRVDYIAPAEEETLVKEIFYGQGNGLRSSRCFIFMLEDKSVSKTSSLEEEQHNQEAGVDTGRLYGICVIHPRLMRIPVDGGDQRSTPPDAGSGSGTGGGGGWFSSSLRKQQQSGGGVARRLSTNSQDSDASSLAPTNELTKTSSGLLLDFPDTHSHTHTKGREMRSFESPVCYAFITKFPLFEFFFRVLSDMISLEKLARMERMVLAGPAGRNMEHDDLDGYEYVPALLLRSVLDRLTLVTPPRFGQLLSFAVKPPAIPAIEMLRRRPVSDAPEHISNAADWALPTLLSWLPVDNLVWLLSLLLCEVKVVVVGREAGMVSCVVMSLLALLRPLAWVAPLIPVLPLKYIDFVESPVPLLTGVVIEGPPSSSSRGYRGGGGGDDSDDDGQRYNEGEEEFSLHVSAQAILDKCDDVRCGGLSAVLDTNACEVYMVAAHAALVGELCMPGAESLMDRLNEGAMAREVTERLRYQKSGRRRDSVVLKMDRGAFKPAYTVTEACRAEAARVQHTVSAHLLFVVEKARAAVAAEKAASARQLKHNTPQPSLPSQPQPLSATSSHRGSPVVTREAIELQAPAAPSLPARGGSDSPLLTRRLQEHDHPGSAGASIRPMLSVHTGSADSLAIQQDDDDDAGSGTGTGIYRHESTLATPMLTKGGDMLVVNAECAFGDDAAFLRRFCRTQIFAEYVGESPEDGDSDMSDRADPPLAAVVADVARISLTRELDSLRSSLLVPRLTPRRQSTMESAPPEEPLETPWADNEAALADPDLELTPGVTVRSRGSTKSPRRNRHKQQRLSVGATGDGVAGDDPSASFVWEDYTYSGAGGGGDEEEELPDNNNNNNNRRRRPALVVQSRRKSITLLRGTAGNNSSDNNNDTLHVRPGGSSPDTLQADEEGEGVESRYLDI